jgi:hypothetical protein
MNIQGKLHRITNIVTFLTSWLQTNGHPTAGFVAWPKARINLGTDFPTGQFNSGFIPPMSMDTNTDSQGFFKFTVPELFATNFRGRLVAYNVSSMVPPQIGGIVLPPIPVLEPIYRSQPFKFSDVSATEQAQVQNIFAMKESTPDHLGMAQGSLNDHLADLRQSLKLDKLGAAILSNRISAHARKSGGEVKFDAFVVGSTGSDLTQVIEARVGEIDIDLPGPDFIVGLCISKSDIESQIRVGMATMAKKLSKTMIDAKNALLAQAGAGQLASNFGLSVWRTRHPVTGSTVIKLPGVPDMHLPTMSVVPDPAFGMPVKLY